jgi:hypothetical protein
MPPLQRTCYMTNVLEDITRAQNVIRSCLSEICGFHGGRYEECRLLGYENPSSSFTGDTLRLRYRVQPVNAV